MEANITTLGFFERHNPFVAIVIAFFFVSLPLLFFNGFCPNMLKTTHLDLIYLIVLGNTHFFITGTYYFQSSNFRFFKSSLSNKLIYLVMPLFIFIFFDLYRALGVGSHFPKFHEGFVTTIRIVNFYHFAFQAFGVLQLFKWPIGRLLSQQVKQIERCYFLLLVALMSLRLFSQSPPLDSWLFRFFFGLALISLIYVVAAYPRSSVSLRPLLYLGIQSLCAAAVMYNAELYPFALAVHYVEYHFLMFPRCFEVKLSDSKLDGVFRLLTENKLLFYSGLLLVASLGTMMIASNFTQWTIGPRILLSLFDGIFVFHFFIEAFAWRFSNPYYRKNVFPLYFSKRAGA